jgi:hypothetical protein
MRIASLWPTMQLIVLIACGSEFENTPPPAVSHQVTSAKLFEMNVDQVDTITLVLTDSMRAAVVDSLTVTWSSSDDSIAEPHVLKSHGARPAVEVHAHKRGRAIVTATVTAPAVARGQFADTLTVREHWIGLTVGGIHSCGIAHDGSAYCWGAIASTITVGGLPGLGIGDGSKGGDSLPTAVVSPLRLPFSQLSAGFAHTCGLTKPAGLVLCWGADDSGQLGDGDTITQLIPALIANRGTAGSIVAGDSGTCALGGGQLFGTNLSCWGAVHPTGQPFTNYTAVTLGQTHGCVIDSNTMSCWGSNDRGQLGDGTTTNRPDPTVLVPGAFVQASAGGEQTCAVNSVHQALCWGDNSSGQLGVGTVGGFVTTPRPVLSLTTVATVAAAGFTSFNGVSVGASHTCAVLADSSAVYCWGDDQRGQLGLGTAIGDRGFPQPTPTPGRANIKDPLGRTIRIVAVSTAEAVTGGFRIPNLVYAHTCALTDVGAIYCWGDNSFGQLGLGAVTDPVSTPTRVAEPR